MNCMSCASRSQLPARSATHAAAPSASERFLSTLARACRACLCALVDPFELDPFRRAVLVAILPPPVYQSPTQQAGTHTRASRLERQRLLGDGLVAGGVGHRNSHDHGQPMRALVLLPCRARELRVGRLLAGLRQRLEAPRDAL